MFVKIQQGCNHQILTILTTPAVTKPDANLSVFITCADWVIENANPPPKYASSLKKKLWLWL